MTDVLVNVIGPDTNGNGKSYRTLEDNKFANAVIVQGKGADKKCEFHRVPYLVTLDKDAKESTSLLAFLQTGHIKPADIIKDGEDADIYYIHRNDQDLTASKVVGLKFQEPVKQKFSDDDDDCRHDRFGFSSGYYSQADYDDEGPIDGIDCEDEDDLAFRYTD